MWKSPQLVFCKPMWEFACVFHWVYCAAIWVVRSMVGDLMLQSSKFYPWGNAWRFHLGYRYCLIKAKLQTWIILHVFHVVECSLVSMEQVSFKCGWVRRRQMGLKISLNRLKDSICFHPSSNDGVDTVPGRWQTLRTLFHASLASLLGTRLKKSCYKSREVCVFSI